MQGHQMEKLPQKGQSMGTRTVLLTALTPSMSGSSGLCSTPEPVGSLIMEGAPLSPFSPTWMHQAGVGHLWLYSAVHGREHLDVCMHAGAPTCAAAA